MLDTLADKWGGFEGNAQSFRIVTKLSVNKEDIWGLGLTSKSLNAILKYPWLRGENNEDPDKWGAYESERDEFLRARHGHARFRRSIEAQIMDWADDVTFAVHDLEDFFRAGLIPLDRLVSSTTEREHYVDGFFEHSGREKGLRTNFTRDNLDLAALEEAMDFLFSGIFKGLDPYSGSRQSRLQVRSTSSYLISRYDRGVEAEVKTENGCDAYARLIIPTGLKAEVAVLKSLTWHYVIRRPSLAVIQEGQKSIIECLFTAFEEAADPKSDHSIFPALQQDLLRTATSESEQMRVVVDLISGLTEGMAYELHQRLTGTSRGSILDSAARAIL